MPWTSAVATIHASRSGRLSGTCNAAHRIATSTSIPRIRVAKDFMTYPSSQPRSIFACAAVPLPMRRAPASNSSIVITDKYMLFAEIAAAYATTDGFPRPASTLRNSEITFVSRRYIALNPKIRNLQRVPRKTQRVKLNGPMPGIASISRMFSGFAPSPSSARRR